MASHEVSNKSNDHQMGLLFGPFDYHSIPWFYIYIYNIHISSNVSATACDRETKIEPLSSCILRLQDVKGPNSMLFLFLSFSFFIYIYRSEVRGRDQPRNRFVSFVRARTAVCRSEWISKMTLHLFPFPFPPRQ